MAAAFSSLGQLVREGDTRFDAGGTLSEIGTLPVTSVSSNKLVALSHIAKTVHVESQDEYIAVLWRNEMEADRCWAAHDPQNETAHLTPSSSWAATDD
ncbi:hypothetical protein S40288_11342 [Stachybotrys chartarum IBT 40288]|nr:hypothetical protein S40288_11342 [Stachybotrys chartarum IBT 40288]